MSRYVALLRGINVGGKNLIKMADLKACFEKHGFRDVATYIQSGNVLFTSTRSAGLRLARAIEELALRSLAGEPGIKLSKLASLPIYQRMTVRNWNATTKLHELIAD